MNFRKIKNTLKKLKLKTKNNYKFFKKINYNNMNKKIKNGNNNLQMLKEHINFQ